MRQLSAWLYRVSNAWVALSAVVIFLLFTALVLPADWLMARHGASSSHVAVTGYSFGAQVGLHHAARDPRVGWLVGIALVQEHYTDAFLDDDRRPKLFIAGEHDAWAPPGAMMAYVARLKPPKAMHIIPDTDHFFVGYEGQVAALIVDFVGVH